MSAVIESSPLADDQVSVEKWAAISGKWTFSGNEVEYHGPDEKGKGHPLGIALGAGRFRDGTISTQVKLSRAKKTAAGLLLGYQSQKAPYIAVSLGGFDKAYAISEYRPDSGWISIADAGNLSNLSEDVGYELVVSVNGQSINMRVDDVDVLDVVVPRPIEGTGFGLYAWDDARIGFTNTHLLRVAPRLFVIMPFSEPYDALYRDVIEPVARELRFDVVRVDEIEGRGIILNDIQQQIEQSQLVVAEISTHNANVFYELGYAHALRKPAVLLVRREAGEQMPFDVRGYRANFYDDSIGGKKIVQRNLRQHLEAVVRDS